MSEVSNLSSFSTKVKSAFSIPNFRASWRGLESSQKASIFSLFVLALLLPVFVLTAINQTFFNPRATEPVTPIPPTPPINNISWITNYVSMTADSLTITANGVKYVDMQPGTYVTSDPGTTTYTTLESNWTENGKEMRLSMYFAADNTNWWVTEIRTYGASDGSWIYYKSKAPYFKSPLGTDFVGNVRLTSDSSPTDTGQLVIKNLKLRGFTNLALDNRPPYFAPGRVPVGTVGQPYSYQVVGYDPDETNQLVMTSSTLPTGLSFGPCTQSVENGLAKTTCPITGTPTQTGTTNVIFILSDDQGSTVTKTVLLQIN